LDKNDFTEGISKRQFSGESLIFLWFFGLKPHLLTKKKVGCINDDFLASAVNVPKTYSCINAVQVLFFTF
jgi:hypothetical protein